MLLKSNVKIVIKAIKALVVVTCNKVDVVKDVVVVVVLQDVVMAVAEMEAVVVAFSHILLMAATLVTLGITTAMVA